MEFVRYFTGSCVPVNRAAGFVSGDLLGGWLAWSGVGLGAFGDSRGIWGWLWFSCGVVQFGVGGVISVFRGGFAGAGGGTGRWALIL